MTERITRRALVVRAAAAGTILTVPALLPSSAAALEPPLTEAQLATAAQIIDVLGSEPQATIDARRAEAALRSLRRAFDQQDDGTQELMARALDAVETAEMDDSARSALRPDRGRFSRMDREARRSQLRARTRARDRRLVDASAFAKDIEASAAKADKADVSRRRQDYDQQPGTVFDPRRPGPFAAESRPGAEPGDFPNPPELTTDQLVALAVNFTASAYAPTFDDGLTHWTVSAFSPAT